MKSPWNLGLHNVDKVLSRASLFVAVWSSASYETSNNGMMWMRVLKLVSQSDPVYHDSFFFSRKTAMGFSLILLEN